MASYDFICPPSAQYDHNAEVHAKTDDTQVRRIRLSSPERDEVKEFREGDAADAWFKVAIKHKEGVNLKATFENAQGYVAETKYCHIDVTE